MITTIIFDFGDIFINLDKQATIDGLQRLGLTSWNKDLVRLNISFERSSNCSPDSFAISKPEEIASPIALTNPIVLVRDIWAMKPRPWISILLWISSEEIFSQGSLT
jgi:hypothetical protein